MDKLTKILVGKIISLEEELVQERLYKIEKSGIEKIYKDLLIILSDRNDTIDSIKCENATLKKWNDEMGQYILGLEEKQDKLNITLNELLSNKNDINNILKDNLKEKDNIINELMKMMDKNKPTIKNILKKWVGYAKG